MTEQFWSSGLKDFQVDHYKIYVSMETELKVKLNESISQRGVDLKFAKVENVLKNCIHEFIQ